MTIKELREILIHYDGIEYDNWELSLWDYNNQRELKWASGTYASSKESKTISFPVEVEPVDGEYIDERVKRLINEQSEKK